jgi:hypothetical protein
MGPSSRCYFGDEIIGAQARLGVNPQGVAFLFGQLANVDADSDVLAVRVKHNSGVLQHSEDCRPDHRSRCVSGFEPLQRGQRDFCSRA